MLIGYAGIMVNSSRVIHDFNITICKIIVTDRCEVYHPQRRTIEKLAECIKKKKPTFLFTHLNDVDSVLHDVGCLTPKYIQPIERTDKGMRTLVTR